MQPIPSPREVYKEFQFPLRASKSVTVEPRSVKFIGTDRRIPGKILTKGVDLGRKGAVAATAIYGNSGK